MRSNDPPVMLTVSAMSPLTEISVTDATYRPVELEQNAGRAAADLPPGVYTVRFHEGDQVEEQTALLLPGGPPVQVTQKELVPFESAVPLENTSTTRETHRGPAVELSAADPDVHDGSGGMISIMVRDPGVGHRDTLTAATIEQVPPDVVARLEMKTVDPRSWFVDDVELPIDPTVGLSLRRVDGSEIAPVSAGHVTTHDRVGALKAEVGPGAYRLRLDTGVDRVVEMPIYAPDGWQTMVFFVTREYAAKSAAQTSFPRANFDTASVSLIRPGALLDPSSPESRYTELALQALAGARQLRGAELKDILWGKYRDPMLGVYGGHLLLMQENPDFDLVDTVIGNTEGLIPGHPDVRALRIAAALRRDQPTDADGAFDTPPMLALGWRAVVAASRVDFGLVPPGSLSDLVSDRITRSGPWLVWAEPPEEDAEGVLTAPDGDTLREPGLAVDRLRTALADDDVRGWAAQSESLGPVERALATAIEPESDPVVREVLSKRSLEPASLKSSDEISENQLSRDLGIPVSSVRRLAGALDGKLRDWES